MLSVLQKQSLEKVTLSIPDLQDMFKQVGISHSLARRENYMQRLQKFKDVLDFTWRDDQRKVIEEFIKFEKKIYVVHAVFGSGKTTLLLGMLIHGILHELFKPCEVMFVSFNISIKNEIKRKLTKFGMGSKVTVRTFDSIIYQICKNTGYPHMDLPNFDGKRRHVYNLMFSRDCTYEMPYQPSIIYIDECQDLEKATMEVMKRFFPKSRFVLAGDIFQSIQKEPRESVLWYYTNREDKDVFKIYMNETPRVPEKNLKTLQKALSTYYPEFADRINNWKSSNKTSNADIEWRTLNSYSDIFEELEYFCGKHTAEETMILTFSSAITVKGAMGDIARLRRFLSQQKITVNKNHKKMEEDDYFLTTANSSKGLERDYVICFLTFPLEKAFINLSDDIVVNLITVALTRAKKKVIMYVPTYSDKFSRVLNLFDACPKPTGKIRDDKSLTEFEIADYLNLEHTVTELIRQSIIKYDTRISIKENVKPFHFEKLFDDYVPFSAIIETEEERAFVGTLIENLITSTWAGRFPNLSDYHVDNNPMYNHCSGRIKSLVKAYHVLSRRNIQNIRNQFNGIYCFSQIQMAISNKVVFNFPDITKAELCNYWHLLKPKAIAIRPQQENIKIQANMKMKLLTGVADTLVTHVNNEKEEVTVIEIKASKDREWKDDALTQAMLYALMSGKTWSRLILLNPFMNEKVSYYFNSKQILLLRNKVYNDIMTFNLNCLLAKKTNVLSAKEKLRVENCFFLDVARQNNKVVQVTLIRMVSPIKCEVLVNKYVQNDADNYEDSYKKTRSDKCQIQSAYTRQEIFTEVNKILKEVLYNQDQKTVVYTQTEEKFLDKDIIQQVVVVEKQRDKLLDEIEGYDSLNANMMYVVDLFNAYKFY
jgi:hypothetical protein